MCLDIKPFIIPDERLLVQIMIEEKEGYKGFAFYGDICMNNIKEIILQSQNVENIKNHLGNDLWVQVSGHKDMNGADATFWCGLVSLMHLKEVYRNFDWDISSEKQSYPGFEGNADVYRYKSNLLDEGFESILYYRNFYGVKADYIELSQEFILLNNLWYDYTTKSYWAMYENGESEEAVKFIDDTTIQIKMKFLRKYSAAKQMAILLFFDIRVQASGNLSDYGIDAFNLNYAEDDLVYGLWGVDMNYYGHICSILMGKKIFMPLAIEDSGYWPYEQRETYEDFIIGADEFGQEILCTCDPDKLNNIYDSNPDVPSYFTPVAFKREVLQKYINKPELFQIEDGVLSCQSLWTLSIDNHHKNCIIVFLGDLGKYLPKSERGYWKSFNILVEEGLSDVSFQRAFCNVFSKSNMEDHIFLERYSSLNKKWNKKYGWDLFLPLSREDQYNLTQIRIPFGDSQPEFDQLVLALVKVLIDSLNEKELIVSGNDQANIKGIGKLEKWIQTNKGIGYEEHIIFLRDLQKLRSTGSGHRKGKEYDKISNKFSLSERSKKDSFEVILQKSNSFLKYLEDTFLD